MRVSSIVGLRKIVIVSSECEDVAQVIHNIIYGVSTIGVAHLFSDVGRNPLFLDNIHSFERTAFILFVASLSPLG